MQNRHFRNVFHKLATLYRCPEEQFASCYEEKMKERTDLVEGPQAMLRRSREFIRF